MTRIVFTFFLLFLLTACGKAPPVPDDYFYRLTVNTNETTEPVRLSEDVIYIRGFLAEGIYNERAILFSEDNDSRELQQYHYHFWATSPPDMLRDLLVSYLRSRNAAPLVLAEPGAFDGLIINGRINGFEKLLNDGNPHVNVVLELRLEKIGENRPLVINEYHARLKAGNNAKDLVPVFNAAVLEIYSNFLSDMRAALN